MHDLRAQLIRGFNYDLWANQAWLKTAPDMPDPDKAMAVLRHILVAQMAWHERAAGRADVSVADFDGWVATEEGFVKSSAAWKAVLAETPLEASVKAVRSDGTVWVFPLGELAQHVINHGTYHRGHLRGLADSASFEEFDDTDWVAWLRLTGQVPPA